MKKRIMTVLVPIVLIFLVIAVALASQLFERFSYSKNQADLTEYFHLAQPDEVAMVVQDTLAEEKALLRDGVVYFALSTVEKYFTDVFMSIRSSRCCCLRQTLMSYRFTLGRTAM